MYPSFLIFGLETAWLVPLIGLGVCGLAFLVGWRFLVVQTEKPLAGLEEEIDPSFLKGVTQDRRAVPRRRGNTVEVQLTDDSGNPPIRGWVVDRSQGGLGIMVEQPLAQGQAFKVRPSSASASVPWIEITIRSCRRDGLQYELGCQFHRTPNWNELLQFG